MRSKFQMEMWKMTKDSLRDLQKKLEGDNQMRKDDLQYLSELRVIVGKANSQVIDNMPNDSPVFGEFPDTTIPDFLPLDQWEDASWHNDVAASMEKFGKTDGGMLMRVYIAPDDPDDNPWGNPNIKYVVTVREEGDPDEGENYLECPDNKEMVLHAITIMNKIQPRN